MVKKLTTEQALKALEKGKVIRLASSGHDDVFYKISGCEIHRSVGGSEFRKCHLKLSNLWKHKWELS